MEGGVGRGAGGRGGGRGSAGDRQHEVAGEEVLSIRAVSGSSLSDDGAFSWEVLCNRSWSDAKVFSNENVLPDEVLSDKASPPILSALRLATSRPERLPRSPLGVTESPASVEGGIDRGVGDDGCDGGRGSTPGRQHEVAASMDSPASMEAVVEGLRQEVRTAVGEGASGSYCVSSLGEQGGGRGLRSDDLSGRFDDLVVNNGSLESEKESSFVWEGVGTEGREGGWLGEIIVLCVPGTSIECSVKYKSPGWWEQQHYSCSIFDAPCLTKVLAGLSSSAFDKAVPW